jgi:hypothetical protein
MLKMKVDPEISMKTKDGENLRQVDPDMLMKINNLYVRIRICYENTGDTQGEQHRGRLERQTGG